MTAETVVSARSDTEPPLLRTRDLDEARRYVTDVYVPHDLETHGGNLLDFELRYLAAERLTVGQLTYGADVELVAPPTIGCYLMNLTLHGRTVAAQNGRRVATAAGRGGAMFSPTTPWTVRWSRDAVQYVVKLPRRSLEDHLSRLVHRPIEKPIRFDLGFDLTTPMGTSLLEAVTFLYQELGRPGGVGTHRLVREQLESLVLAQILLAVPNCYSDLLQRPERPASRARIRRVIELIEEKPDANWTLAELAAAAGVTARALQRGFKETVGMSPTAYVRAVRLDRVHADLLEQAGEVSVTDIATRWGFFHLGRFAQQYRERFGVLPSETVRRVLRYGA